jgi:hypothetical protein
MPDQPVAPARWLAAGVVIGLVFLLGGVAASFVWDEWTRTLWGVVLAWMSSLLGTLLQLALDFRASEKRHHNQHEAAVTALRTVRTR